MVCDIPHLLLCPSSLLLHDIFPVGNLVISSPLHKDAESVSVRRRRRSALESWDTGFTRNITSIESYSSSQRLSKGIWEVVYCLMAQDANNETCEFCNLFAPFDKRSGCHETSGQ